jgi:hypothetical protein
MATRLRQSPALNSQAIETAKSAPVKVGGTRFQDPARQPCTGVTPSISWPRTSRTQRNAALVAGTPA